MGGVNYLGRSAKAIVAHQPGLFDFTVTGCTPSSVLNFTITYPQTLPPGKVLEIWSDAGRRVEQHATLVRTAGRDQLQHHYVLDYPMAGWPTARQRRSSCRLVPLRVATPIQGADASGFCRPQLKSYRRPYEIFGLARHLPIFNPQPDHPPELSGIVRDQY